MRCKKHYTDLSSIVGVCASCLRERLFSIIAAQTQAHSLQEEESPRVSDFPRSVSPYISRRKSDNSANSTVAVDVQRVENRKSRSDTRDNYSLPDARFFSTPQPQVESGYGSTYGVQIKKKNKYNFIRFSLLTNLFRSSSNKKRNDSGSVFCSDLNQDQNPRVSVSASSVSHSGGDSATSALSSPSWFRKKKKQHPFSSAPRHQYCSDRGMSPARYSDCEEEFSDCDSRKQTPWRTPVNPAFRRGGGGGGGGGLNFCLSPLVRASPCRNWSQKAPQSNTDCGDIRAPVKPQLWANRSRKLADFGKSY